jgi:hypothetical protein
VNRDFQHDRDSVKDADSKPPAYKNPQKPTCDELRDRIKRLEDAIKSRQNFANKWYGGNMNAGHAGRIDTLTKDLEKLKRRLARGDCECP